MAWLARGGVVVAVVAAMSCGGTSTRGVIPTSDGGVRVVRSPYCDMFTGANVVQTDSYVMNLCSPEMPEDAPCSFQGAQEHRCTSFERWAPELGEYYQTNRVPRQCSPYTSRQGFIPCRGDVGQGCGSGSVCVIGLQGAPFPVCIPLPCNNN